MRSSRGSSGSARLAAIGLFLIAAGGVSAHRRDEYLQAARLAIEPAAVRLEMDLTPGIAMAEAIIAGIDRDRDGSLSPAEQHAYGMLVVSAVDVEFDGHAVRAELSGVGFPELDAVRRGEGTIRVRSTAVLTPASAGLHQLLFRNRHHPEQSVYLANALVPETSQVSITAQRRDREQTELAIDYLLRGDPPRGSGGWLVAVIAAGTLVSALLVRPLRWRR